MAQVFVPTGGYRLHYGPADMAEQMVANKFGLAGLMGAEDPRGIPARGATVVLPMVRGRDGWFYYGGRAQDKGSGVGMGAAQPTSYNLVPGGATSASQVPGINAPGTITPANAYQQSLGIAYIVTAADGTSVDYRADGTLWTPPGAGGTAQQMIAAQQVMAAQAPVTQTPVTPVVQPPAPQTPQELATAVTGKPNQSVPPSTPLTPLPTGTGEAGGNVLLPSSTAASSTAAPTSSSGTWLLIGGAAVLFFLMKKK